MTYTSVSLAIAGLILSPLTMAQLFTVNCEPLTIQRGDPIVDPGVLSSHVHAVVGGTAFALSQSNEAAKAARATTCDKILDNSNYWQPQLYHQRRDGKFEIVNFQGAAAYYISRACDYAPGRRNCNGSPAPKAPPAGLRMVVGEPSLRTYNHSNPAQRAISHVCLGRGTSKETPNFPSGQCERMRAETFFPSCWDGKNLDSSNHRKHMAFPVIGDFNTGVCPQSHPVAIFSVFFEFFYDTGAIKNFNRLVWANGDPTGYGLHGDYLNGWKDQDRLGRAMDTCTGPGGVNAPGCSLNVGPNGPGHSSRQALQTPPPTEDVGLKAPIDKLPGNNPVTQ
ncbi:hypothetical protein JDV02_008740 [Purpureocillium takamizusanense]|uniref:DUF1996 domain-containing protein n=1 Tax=Purpureocillium takamizusanense TaxID=2060973 RepID=A0A9Q8QR04_9HYPO|nr:uncharacterized protein JDV02_008740 [Purpureocillium takamizusanense]UNI22897.1 hypothetical protein JDV02_008740 [Purpureocillium takamizusanense]